MYQLKLSVSFLLWFHLYSSTKGADPAKNGSVRLHATDPLNFPTTDQLTDNILSQMKYLVDAEVKHSNSTLFSPDLKETEENSSKDDNTITNHEDRLSSTILCSNISKCKTLTLRESRTLKTLAFLAGLKFGKHFLHGAQVGAGFQNSGSFAASNSLNLFGKVLNTALSVSYGSPLEGDIVADEPVRPSFMSAVSSDVHVQTGPLADPTTPSPAVASVLMLITSTRKPEVSSEPSEEPKPADITTTTLADTQPSFKSIPDKPKEDAPEAVSKDNFTERQVMLSSGLADQPSPVPLKVVTVEPEPYSGATFPPPPQYPKTDTQPQPTQIIVSSVRRSQPKTKEQLIYNSRKRFLDEHNERFRKLFGNSATHNAIPQIGIMLHRPGSNSL